MTTIEGLIHEAAKSGRFNLTVFETGKGFQAGFSRDKQSWRCETDTDPVAAVKRALGAPRLSVLTQDTDLFG